MIVSMAMAVLPVLRSPMISSRWPRPIGVIASIALMPVCSGSLHRLPLGDAGGDDFDRPALGGDDRALAVERVAERIDARGRSRASPTGTLSSLPGRA